MDITYNKTDFDDFVAVWGRGTVNAPAPDRGLRAILDDERAAHCKTLQLLIEKDQLLVQYELTAAAMQQEAALCKAERNVAFEQWSLQERAADRHAKVSELCIPIVRDLFEFTSDHKIHAACKAALAAYEELPHGPVPVNAAPDPAAVGDAEVRHLSDCQSERPQGVAGGQLPGPAGRPADGAAPQENQVLEAVKRCSREPNTWW